MFSQGCELLWMLKTGETLLSMALLESQLIMSSWAELFIITIPTIAISHTRTVKQVKKKVNSFLVLHPFTTTFCIYTYLTVDLYFVEKYNEA